MKVKQWMLQLLPIALVAAGCVLVAVTSWHLIRFALHVAQGYVVTLWYPLLQAWFLGLAAYLIFTGLRKMRDAKDVMGSKTPSLAWGRMLVGTFLIISSSFNLIHPGQNSFKLYPSDENIKKFTEIFTFACMLLGAWLVYSSVRARYAGSHKTSPN